MKWFRKKGFLFQVGYSLAIVAWFSYASLNGLDMLSYTKSSGWESKGQYYQSMHHK